MDSFDMGPMDFDAHDKIKALEKRIEDLETAYAGLIALSLSDGEKASLKEIAKHS